MTGPEHYREAERLISEAGKLPHAVVTLSETATMADVAAVKKRLGDERGWDVVAAAPPTSINVTPLLLAAQVHATLAHAAAVAESGGLDHQPEWRDIVLPENQRGEPS